jgi:cell division septation protein DedD
MLLCGSFQNKDKALNLAEKIKSKGYPAFVEKADLGPKGVWYRIKIAGISKDAAEKTRDELKIKLKIDAIIAQRK